MFVILLVDDNECFQDALARCLKQNMRNATVLTALNGKDGTEILKSIQVDLIITDLQMPVMNGHDLINYRNQYFHKIPLIVITADTSHDVLDGLKAQGVDEFVEKPCECEAVASLAVNVLEARKTAPHRVLIPRNPSL